MAKDAYGNPLTPVTGTDIDTDYGGAVAGRVIPVYPSSTARDAAITSPVEGQVCYREDGQALQIYNGSAWKDKVFSATDHAEMQQNTADTGATNTSTWYQLPYLPVSAMGAVELSMVTRTRALVTVSAQVRNDTAGKYTEVGVVVGGASSVVVASTRCLHYESSNANDYLKASYTRLYATLSAGTNTFKVAARASGGISYLRYVELTVIPL